MTKLIGCLFRRASVVAHLGGVLGAMAMLLVTHSDQSVAQTTVEPGNNFIAAGDHFSLAVTCDGRVYAWGGNQNGQLGVDSEKNQQVPVQVHGVNNEGYLSDITDVGAGFYRSLALKTDGTVYAWGENSNGDLGTGHTTLDLPLKTPGQVYGNWSFSSYLGGVKNVDDGGQHSLALRNDGKVVWAWGDNYHCQLGSFDCGGSNPYPVPVNGLPAGASVVDLVGGGYHSLALMSDGYVYAWGAGGHGQLGINSDKDHNTAVQVHGPDNVGYLTGITKVAAGLHHSLAIMSDGTVYAWGGNSYYQLGNTHGDSHIPVQVIGLSDVVDVAGGEHHSLALKSDGTVYAWGSDFYGQLGTGTGQVYHPTQVKGPDGTGTLTGIIDVEAGAYFSLALRNDGTVWAWGGNSYGQLGISSTKDQFYPVQVHGPDNVDYLTGIGPLDACNPPQLPGAAMGHILDQSQTVTTGYGEVGSGEPRGGQVFTAGLYGILDQVSVEVASSARSPATGPVHISIQTLTDDGLPSGIEIGSGTIPLSAIPPAGSPAWLDVSISPTKVTTGTEYALLLSTDGGIVDWYMYATSEPDLYPEGYRVVKPLDTWEEVLDNTDAGFETYVWPSTVDQSQTVDNRFSIFGDGERMGQTFTAGLFGILGQVSVELENHWYEPTSEPVDVSIQTLTDKGLPSGIEIGSGTIPLSAIPPAGSPAWVDVGVSDAYVTPGTQYALVLSLSGDGYVRWADNYDGSSYAGGAEVFGDALLSYDTAFETYVMPSTLDQSYSSPGFMFFSFGGDFVLAQTFTAGLYGILDRVGLCLANSARTPAVGPVHVSIQTLTNTGLPSGTEIGSGTISLDIIPPAGDCAWVDASISVASLTAGTPYAIALSTSWPGEVVWDGILDGYPGGRSFLWEGTRWDTGYDDMSFETYVIPAAMPGAPATQIPQASSGNSPTTWRDTVLGELLRRSNPSPQ